MSGVPRLEDTRLVEGSYHQEIIDSQIIRERHYTLAAEGSPAWDGSRDFYLSRDSRWTVAAVATLMLVVVNFAQSYASYEP